MRRSHINISPMAIRTHSVHLRPQPVNSIRLQSFPQLRVLFQFSFLGRNLNLRPFSQRTRLEDDSLSRSKFDDRTSVVSSPMVKSPLLNSSSSRTSNPYKDMHAGTQKPTIQEYANAIARAVRVEKFNMVFSFYRELREHKVRIFLCNHTLFIFLIPNAAETHSGCYE